jgi:hypothetical protein
MFSLLLDSGTGRLWMLQDAEADKGPKHRWVLAAEAPYFEGAPAADPPPRAGRFGWSQMLVVRPVAAGRIQFTFDALFDI